MMQTENVNLPDVESKEAPDRPDQPQPELETKQDDTAPEPEAAATPPESDAQPVLGDYWYDGLGRRVIRFGRPITFKGTKHDNGITVDEDVIKEVFIRNTPDPLFVQVYTRGELLPPTEANALDKG
jgi:hypothetical protein